MKKKLSPPAKVEIVFDVLYLVFVLTAGTVMLIRAQGRTELLFFGLMAVILGGGDAFHLVPRIYAQATGQMQALKPVLGTGKQITSITMTVFYVLLYAANPFLTGTPLPLWLSILVGALALVRIVLCLCPQNKWRAGDDARWGILRNIPFALLGLAVLLLYAVTAGKVLPLLWLAIVLSFGFYLPVVLGAEKHPKLGMLMLPKTCAYVWMVCMGLSLL